MYYVIIKSGVVITSQSINRPYLIDLAGLYSVLLEYDIKTQTIQEESW